MQYYEQNEQMFFSQLYLRNSVIQDCAFSLQVVIHFHLESISLFLVQTYRLFYQFLEIYDMIPYIFNLF